MINVSQQFLNAIYRTDRFVSIRGTLTKNGEVTNLVENDFVKGSISMKSKAVDGNSFRIGEVYIDTLNFSLGVRENQFLNITGSIVELEYGIEVEDNDLEWCSLGVFTIPSDGVIRKNKIIAISADSNMSKADKDLGGTTTSGSPFDMANWACAGCGLTLGTSTETFASFANGQDTFEMPSRDDFEISTYRDLLMWIAEITCTFVTCDRLGRIVFKPYSGVSVWTLNPDTISAKSFSDYPFNVQSVAMAVGDNYYNTDQTIPEENCLVLDENPFIINRETSVYRMLFLNNILSSLGEVQFTPFNIDFNGNPALEVGDWITYNGEDYLITSISFKYRGKCNISGVGISTGNAKKQASSSKGGSGGGGSSSDKLGVVRYENSTDLTINSSRKLISNIQFELGANSVPFLGLSMIVSVQTEGDFQIDIVYDNATLLFKPKYTLPVGYHNIAFTYPLQARDVNMTHQLMMYFKSIPDVNEHYGEAEVVMAEAVSYIQAWNATSGAIEWNGRIDINEEMPLFNMNMAGYGVLGVSEILSIDTDYSITIINQPTDYIGAIGTVARFEITATGDNLTYNWEFSTNNGSSWASTGTHTPIYELTLTTDRVGWMFRCVLADSHSNTVTSNEVTMTELIP